MWKSVRLLTWLSLCNLFGFNEARFSKDPKKKNRLLTVAFAMLILGGMMVFYAGALTFAFIDMGLSEMIPMYLCVMISLLTFMFSVFRAGPALFSLRQFERLSVLPVRPAAIVISRFISLYVTELFVSVFSTGAVIVVCALNASFSPWFYISMLLGSLILPLVPMTAAMIVGTGIYAVTASMRRKNIMQLIFSFAFLALYFSFMNSMNGATEDMVIGLAEKIGAFKRFYPPAHWFSEGVYGNVGCYLLFFAISIAIFLCFAWIVGRYYRFICTHLTSNAAKRNFVMREQKGRSALRACFFRERKRYFASANYVMNTAIGYILTIVLVAMACFGEAGLLATQIPSRVIAKLAPFLLALFSNVSPTTTASVSMEGKHFWLTQTLPVRTRDIMNAKILVNLMISVPCMLISSVLLAIAARPNLADLFWLIFLPLLYALFGSVLGLFVNLKLPMMHWDNEAQPVKQGKSTLIMMFAGFFTSFLPVIPMVLVLLISDVAAHIALIVISLVLCLLIHLLHRKVCAFDLKKIAEDS